MTTQRTVLNWLLVYLLVFISGSWRYNLSANKYLVLVFLFAFAAWYLFTDRKISDKFLLYALVYFGFLFSLGLYTSGGVTLASAISGLMKLMIAYLAIKTVSSSFVSIYIKLIVFLAIVSLIGFATDQYYLLDGLIRRLPPVGDMGYEGVFYLFRFPWHMDRNNSIFFEPGAYQAFLNGAIFLLAFTETRFDSRTKWTFIGILAVTLVTTGSTTGFVLFALMFPVFLYKSHIATFSGKVMIVAAIFGVSVILGAQYLSSIMAKIDAYTGQEGTVTSDDALATSGAANRASDYKADLEIFRRHIFGIGYAQYEQEFGSARGDISIEAGSNGITGTLAKNGLPFALFLFGSYYWAVMRLLGDYLLASLAFGMVMLFLWAESYYVGAPILCALVAGAFVHERRSAQRATGELAD